MKNTFVPGALLFLALTPYTQNPDEIPLSKNGAPEFEYRKADWMADNHFLPRVTPNK